MYEIIVLKNMSCKIIACVNGMLLHNSCGFMKETPDVFNRRVPNFHNVKMWFFIF